MAGMGPPPKPPGERRRRNATPTTTKLPAEGRQGPPPEWPLLVGERFAEFHDRELELWTQVWTTPQAVAWERLRWTHDVAMYVRWSVLAEAGSLDAGKEARQVSDRLGLTPLALLRLRWEVVADETAERRTPARTRARTRLKAVDGAVAGA
jgi:hypothetical protein